MTKEQWHYYYEITLLLTQIACRNGNYEHWFRHEPDSDSGKLFVICNICNTEIVNLLNVIEPIRCHGLQHLKENNLLPFI